MQVAHCTLDGKNHLANEFEMIADRENKRKYLICTSCKMPSYFRIRSIDGKAACFGSRNHLKNCTFLTLNNQDDNNANTTKLIVDALINNGENIKIRFDNSPDDRTNDNLENKPSPSTMNNVSHSSTSGDNNSISSHGFKSILDIIIHDEQKVFVKSDKLIQLEYGNPYKAKNLFKSFDEINESEINKYRFIYGVIVGISPKCKEENKPDDECSTIWINFTEKEYQESFSIQINLLHDRN